MTIEKFEKESTFKIGNKNTVLVNILLNKVIYIFMVE